MRSKDAPERGVASERSGTAAAAPLPAPLGPARILALQRSAGNAAVGRVLARVKAVTLGGEWNAQPYTEFDNPEGAKGAHIQLEFTPNANATADRIGLTQVIKAVKGDQQYRSADDKASSHAQKKLSVPSGPEKDWMIDRALGNPNPIYGADKLADTTNKTIADTSFTDQKNDSEKNDAFERGRNDKAVLIDKPARKTPLAANARMEFETTAVALAGPQKDSYYGSVAWGWTTDGTGALSLIPFAVKSQGNPTSAFTKSAEVWNKSSNKTNQGTGVDEETQEFGPVYSMSTKPQDANLKLPIPTAEGPIVLPPQLVYKAMKKAAKARFTPKSGKLPVADYGAIVVEYNGHTTANRWAQAKQTLDRLKAKLDEMDSAAKYWKTADAKAKHFTPILKAVEAHQALVADKLKG